MTTQQEHNVLERVADGVAILRLNHPERLNALSGAAVHALRDRLDEIALDDSIRVVVLTGAGRGFCAGWDLKSGMEGASAAEPSSVPAQFKGQQLFEGMIRRVRALDKVVIAAVNGVAVGAGFALTLASDIRLAARSASFHVGAVRIGLTAGECGISYHLPRLIGASRAFEVMLSGRPIPAEEAERIGLVSAMVDDDALLDRALSLAAEVTRNSPYAVKHTKRVMWANLEASSLNAALELENHAQILALQTQDFAEAARAFAEKRPPKFTGR